MDVPNIIQTDIQHSRRVIREPDDFGDAVSGMNLTVDFQKRQERASLVEQFQAPCWALDFGEANVRTRVRGVLRGRWGSLCLTRGPGAAVWNGQPAGPGAAALLPPDDEVDGFTTAAYAWVTAAIPPVVWRDCLAVAGLDEDRVRHLKVLPLEPSLFAKIDSTLRALHQRMLRLQSHASPAVQSGVRQDVTAFVSECFTLLCGQSVGAAPPPASLRNRARLVRHAQTWMQDHLGEAVRVPDACLALRVSRRELEYAFRSILDQSPRDYFQGLRLNAIRRALVRADTRHETLIQIAYAHGVTHLGRFAANYRQLFGENPGVTMKAEKDFHGMPAVSSNG